MLALDPKAQIKSSTEVNPGIPKTTYVVDAKSLRNVVLVAGCDYPPPHGLTFSVFCKRRYELYLRRGPEIKDNPNWRFTIFDVPTGEVSENTFDTKTGKRAWKVVKTPATFSKVTALNYTLENGHMRFTKNTAGVMSITDVYQHVRDLGVNFPGSLWELSFFSHGWMGGPILVNSRDQDPSAAARDPNDKDPRLNKDFIGPTMDAAARAEFRSAFHAEGSIWSWGCSFPRGFHEVIEQVVNAAAFKSNGATADDDMFDFHFYDQDMQAKAYFHFDTTFFPSADTSGNYPLDFSRTFLEVKGYFERGRKRTYSQAIATASDRACYGALLGTDALPEQQGVSPGLLVIPTKVPPYPHSFARYLTFYTKYLNFTPDPEGRGYGKFVP